MEMQQRSDPDEPNEEVFYSAASSAVSDATLSAGSEPPQSPTPSPSTGAKAKGLSKLKMKTRKLIPKRFKTHHQVSPADVVSGGDTTPESTQPLMDKKSKKESTLSDKDEEEEGVQKSDKDKEKKKKSRAGNLVRRLTFGKRSKVVPTSTEDDPATSSSTATTPGSAKRETTNLNASQQSLLEIEDPQGVDEIEAKNATLTTTLKSFMTSGGIDDDDKKKKKKFNKASGVELHSTSTAAAAAAAIAAATVAAGGRGGDIKSSKKDNKKLKIDQKQQQQQLPTPPPTPPYTHIPLKIIEDSGGSGSKPISAKPNATQAAGTTIATDQIATMADSGDKKNTTTTSTTTNSGGGAVATIPKPVVGSSSEVQSSTGKQSSNIIGLIKKENLKTKFLKNITASTSDISPPSRAPAVPYNISELEIASILDRKQKSTTNKLFAKLPKELPDPPLASSEDASLTLDADYEQKIKLDREESAKATNTVQIFTTSESQEFMKRSDDGGNSDPIVEKNQKKKSKRSTDHSPVTNPTVHVQEAKQPYQLSSSSQDKDTPSSSLTPDVPKEQINFRIGTPVRPVKTLQSITHIADISIDSNTGESLAQKDEVSSLSSDSQSPPSESSRRRIKYIPQATEEGSNDDNLLEPGPFGQPSSFVSDTYSIDYSLNPLSMAGNTDGDGQGVSSASITLGANVEKYDKIA